MIMKQVKEHNMMERNRGSKIKTEDIQALGNVLEQSEWLQRESRTIYQYHDPKHTADPVNRLGSKLSSLYESEVKKEENAMWYGMFEWSKEKADAWLQRTDDRFDFKVEEQIAKGKKPNLLNQAVQYRDTGPDFVWKISCVKV